MDCTKAQMLVTAYVKDELQGKELEEFLEHIKNCEECYEELEIYFTIHFALKQLDDETHSTYDVHKLLVEDLQNRQTRVRRKKRFHYFSLFCTILAEAAILIALITQIQIWAFGDYEYTNLHRFISSRPVRQEMTEKEMDKL